MEFENLNLNKQLLSNIKNINFHQMTNIQCNVIDHILNNKDVLAIAQTGSGKTAAYSIPIIEKLINTKVQNKINCIILVPTRDLVNQVYETFLNLTESLELSVCKIMGGADKQSQIEELKNKANIVIAAVGRFKELVKLKVIDFSKLQFLVIDEFDKMLDLGFRKDILGFIQQLKDKHLDYQTLLFSATNPEHIQPLIKICLKQDFAFVKCDEQKTINDLVKQKFLIGHKTYLIKFLLNAIYEYNQQIIIFLNTINECKKIETLLKYMNLKVKCIHGDCSQQHRNQVILDFKEKKFSILISTDILSRGIDIKDLKLIINYNLPDNIETYIHRSGRVGRSNIMGQVISICKLEDFDKIQKIISKYELTNVQIIDKDEWKKPLNEDLKDIINYYYSKFN